MKPGHRIMPVMLSTLVSMAAYAAVALNTSSGGSGAKPVVLATLAATAAAVAPVPNATPLPPASSANTATAGMQFGTQTHFSQGWSQSTLAQATQLGAPLLRDSLAWSAAEPTPGTYNFTGPAAQALQAACARGLRLIVTVPPANPLYDGGKWVTTATGQAAYAAYLDALATRFGTCLAGIQLGNELNGGSNMAFPAGTDAPKAYVALARAVKARLGGRVPVVAGSTNMIATGFLKPFFAAGLLAHVDAISVHPYRLRGEGLDIELANLDAAMTAAGRRVPVWATEFSVDSPDTAFAAGELVKQATLLAGAGVPVASWYALLDQTWFPDMGLIHDGGVKPQGRAFAALQPVLALGRPTRVDLGDPLLFAWRFGADTTVIWGSPRSLFIGAGGSVTDAMGSAVSGPVMIGEAPLIVRGTTALQPGASDWVADSLMGWATAQWRAYAVGGPPTKLAYTPLALFNDQFDSYFGAKGLRPLRIGTTSAAPAGDGTNPVRTGLRYTAPQTQALELRGCMAKTASGDGVDLTVLRNGKVLFARVVTASLTMDPVPLDLSLGDKVDVLVGPNRTFGGDAYRYRFVLFRKGQGTQVACPS